MQKWNKVRSNFTQLVKNEQVVADAAGRKHFVTPNEMSGQNRSKELHGQTGRIYASSSHPHPRKRITKDEQRRLILKAQSQSAGTKELYVDVAVSDNKNTDAFTSKTVTHGSMLNKTTSLPTRSTTTGSERERQIVTSIRKERGRISTNRLGHSMSRPDYMSSPYYLDSIHPLHIDLVQLVRKKIERGVKFPVDPVNALKIDYVYKPGDCKFKSSQYNFSLLVIVRSDAQHLDMRSMIRSTWGNVSMHLNVRLVFAVGVERHTDTDVHEESKRYGDILQGSFIENAFSATNKTTMALTWSNRSCPDADVILLTEEDHLVQIKHILEYIITFDQLKLSNLFAGFVINHSEVQRTTKSPWSVKWTDFPHKFWPPYLRKGCMLISREVARQLTEAFPYVKFIHVHDAYLGIVARKLSLVLQNDVRFFQTADNLLTKRNYFAFDGFNSSKLLNESWYNLTHRQK
ncbi:Beta-1,3-galactosyltransferase brn [Mizuhopecten yessoensis]|uniref:Hexosyltransferase n=1 Tax=Mizuhopecten yessoensis TaxID=6573 RepID=A0A210PTJ5_MIZYE|nr:Beta-1,3-galactosyltransferase brn [Mizuhopecten yessoensis]